MKSSFSPLTQAVVSGDIAVVRLLIECGAELNPSGSSLSQALSPLRTAARHRSTEIVKLLLEKGARVDLNNPADFEILDFAISHPDPEVSRLIFEAGAPVEWRRTPLVKALQHGQEAVVIQYGADVSARDSFITGLTPLEAAEQQGKYPIAALLRSHLSL
jgi:ankyrin repeat protein